MKKTLKLVAVLVAVVMMAAACGDDDGGGSTASADNPLVQAIVAEVTSDSDALTADQAQAECFVGGVVGGIGEERLNELGVTEDNVPSLDEIAWTDDEADTVVDAMFDCIEMEEMFMEQMDFGELDDDQADCVRGVFSEDVLKGFFAATLTNDEEAGAGILSLLGELAECGIDMGS